MMAYDPAIGAVVLFGGAAASGADFRDTWTFVNGSWHDLTSKLATAPSARQDAGMVYDPGLHAIVLFGGRTGTGPGTFHNDTWLFYGTGWGNLNPFVDPGPIDPLPLAYDSIDGYLLLASHPWASSTPRVDWEFAGGVWTNVTSTVHGSLPSLDFFASTDPTMGSILYFGGIPSGSCTGRSQTWAYERGSFLNLTANQTVVPRDAMGSSAITYDGQSAGIVQFGGYTANCAATNGTYLFRGNAWKSLSPAGPTPPGRWMGELAYDSATGTDILFGGNGALLGGSTTLLNDTWTFTGPLGPQPEDGNWTVWSRAPQVNDPALAYDAHDGYALLFGGNGPGPGAGDIVHPESNGTWRFVNGSWSELAPSAAPSPRILASMVYDAADGYVLLFGGQRYDFSRNNWVYYNDTWTFSGGRWTELHPALAPPAYAPGGLVYDAADSEVLLYGGYSSNGSFNDTWTYSAGTWSGHVGLAAPPVDRGFAISYDAADGYVLLFGGNNPSTGAITNETWKFLGNHWSALAPAVVPPGRAQAEMAYDGQDGYTLLVDGHNASPTFIGNLRDSWKYLAGTWTNITSSSQPSADSGAAMIYDPAAKQLLLYDGNGLTTGTSAGPSNSWFYSSGSWTVVPRTTYPAPECCGAATYDTADGLPVFFGGAEPTGASTYQTLNTTWTFLNNTWAAVTSLSPPPGRYYSGLAYDAADGYALLYGGAWGDCSLTCGYYQDTWTFSQGAWSQVFPAQSPGKRCCFSLDYDPSVGKVVLFGGYSSSGKILNDTWEYSAGAWTQVYPRSSPPPLQFGVMDFDQVDNYTLLYGGKNGAGNSGETWAFENSTWVELFPAAAPSWRWGETLVYDGETNSLLLFGGYTNGSPDQDTWGFQGGVWTPLARSLAPTNSSLQEALYDPQLGEILMFGGIGRSYLSALWGWNYSGPLLVKDVTESRASVDVAQSIRWGIWFEGGQGGVTVTWAGLPTGCASANRSELTCAPSGPGNFSITVRLSDARGQVATGGPMRLSVWSDPAASKPGANRTSLDAGQQLLMDVAASGGAGGFSYAWSGLPFPCTGSLPAIRCVPGAAGSFNVSVRITDSNRFTVVSPITTITVFADPIANGVRASTPAADVGEAVTFSSSALLGSGGNSWAWNGLPDGCPTSDNTTNVICAFLTTAGSYVVSATVTDSNRMSSTSPGVDFTVFPDPSVSTPAPSQPSADVNQTVTFTANAQDGSGGYTYQWAGLPAGCGPGTSIVTCTVTTPGHYAITVTLTDSTDFSVTSGVRSFTVYRAPTVAPPTFNRSSVDVGQSVTVSTNVSGGSGGFVYAWTGLPVGCPTVGQPVRCTALQAGSYVANVTVTDSNGYSSTAGPVAFVVFLIPTIQAPSVSPRSADVGQRATFTANFTPGSGGDVVQWSGLPVSCGSIGLVVPCTFHVNATLNVSAQVTDSNGGSASSPTIEFSVFPDPTLSPPAANRSAADVGQVVAFSTLPSGGSGNFTYSWTGIPASCATSTNRPTCRFSDPGTYEISVTARDSNGVASAPSEVAFAVYPVLKLSGPTAPSSVTDVGHAVRFSAVLTGGSGGWTYLWTGLPDGCASVNGSVLTCRPASAGTWTILLQVTDSNDAIVVGSSFTLLVNPPLVIASLGATPSDVLSGASLQLIADVGGGTAPYSYAWTGLPAGCLGGNRSEIVCNPTGTGSYVVTVAVTDSTGQRESSNVTLNVAASLVGLPVAEAYGLLGAVLAIAVIAGLLIFVLRRRRATPDPRTSEEGEVPPEEAAVPDERSNASADPLEEDPESGSMDLPAH